MEVDLQDAQSVEIASPVKEESEVNQLTYFNNTDVYWYIAAIMTHDKTKSITTPPLPLPPPPPTLGCEPSSPWNAVQVFVSIFYKFPTILVLHLSRENSEVIIDFGNEKV